MNRIVLTTAATAALATAGSALAAPIVVFNFNDSNLIVDRESVIGVPTLTTNFVAANVTYFTGTTVNADGGDAAGQSLALQGGESTINNGRSIIFAVNLTGFQDLVIDFATQKTSTGFTSNQFAYSTDGSTFTNFGSLYNPPTSFGLQAFDLSSISALDNNPNAQFRITFSGATSSAGNNRIDNFVFDAGAFVAAPVIPEPLAAGAAGLIGLVAMRRRRAVA